MDDIISIINAKVDVFNQMYQSSEKLQKHLEGLEKILFVELEDTGSFYLKFDSSGLSQAVKGVPELEVDINIRSTADIFRGVLTGEEKKMKAIVTKKIRLKAKKMKDLLLLKKLLSTKSDDLE